jgi:hypothetical protein
MTLNERILDFLDGSLPPDDEAELLHTLSVSPEKRGLMRTFMEQRALLERDSKSLTVPYEAEQRLWSRLDMLMPLEQGATSSVSPVLLPVETQTAGFLARAFTASSATVGGFMLVAGIGIGFFAGRNAATPVSSNIARSTILREQTPPANTAAQAARTRAPRYAARQSAMNVPFGFLPNFPSISLNASQANIIQAPSNNIQPPPADASIPVQQNRDVPTFAAINFKSVDARPIQPVAIADIGGDGSGIKPLFHQVQGRPEPGKTILQRFEFQVDESFGRQFPNSVETNVSLPLITNTSLSALFQILPNSTLLWAGGAYGTANVTRKTLFTTAGNQIDPLQDVLASDTVHSQTSYLAAMAELRLPAFASAELTFTGGYGIASLGQMLFGEIGIHYDVTSTAGIETGIRVLKFTYDLTGEKSAAIASGTSGLVIPNAVASASPSINTELNCGLFFHF